MIFKYYYNGEERDFYDIEYIGPDFKMMKSNGKDIDFYNFNSDGSYSINGALANDEIDTQSLHIGSTKQQIKKVLIETGMEAI